MLQLSQRCTAQYTSNLQ